MSTYTNLVGCIGTVLDLFNTSTSSRAHLRKEGLRLLSQLVTLAGLRPDSSPHWISQLLCSQHQCLVMQTELASALSGTPKVGTQKHSRLQPPRFSATEAPTEAASVARVVKQVRKQSFLHEHDMHKYMLEHDMDEYMLGADHAVLTLAGRCASTVHYVHMQTNVIAMGNVATAEQLSV